jgi:hypothetical protein
MDTDRGARAAISGLAIEVTCQVGLQTGSQATFTTTPAVAFGVGPQEVLRISRQVGPGLDCGIGCQVPVGFAPQTGPLTKARIDSGKPFGVALDTTSRTVPGTVSRLVRGMSILTTLTAPKAFFFGRLASFGLD